MSLRYEPMQRVEMYTNEARVMVGPDCPWLQQPLANVFQGIMSRTPVQVRLSSYRGVTGNGKGHGDGRYL